jgi:adenosine deaminase
MMAGYHGACHRFNPNAVQHFCLHRCSIFMQSAPPIPAQTSFQKQVVSLPKVLLHEHLDGGLRPQTLLALCSARGLQAPSSTPEGLARWLHAQAQGSLEQYVSSFALTVAAMASPEACERVAFEAAEDARLEGCIAAEFRMAPTLLEAHGLRADAALEAMLAGLKRSAMPSGYIVCAMRTDTPSQVLRSAKLAAAYAGQGVVGFDLAGAEKGFPATAHAQAIDLARSSGLGITLHAGEADIGARVLEAARLGATRIGHGVHIMLGEDRDALLDAIAPYKLHFEVCPTSNIHTGVVKSIAEHPIRAMWEAGLSLSCNTDNRLVSGVSVCGELLALHTELGFGLDDFERMTQMARDALFLKF